MYMSQLDHCIVVGNENDTVMLTLHNDSFINLLLYVDNVLILYVDNVLINVDRKFDQLKDQWSKKFEMK